MEAVRAGEIGVADLRIHPETLERQAVVAEEHGNPQLAENLRRAAELTRLPDDEVLAVYEALRPGRSTPAQLTALAASLADPRPAALRGPADRGGRRLRPPRAVRVTVIAGRRRGERHDRGRAGVRGQDPGRGTGADPRPQGIGGLAARRRRAGPPAGTPARVHGRRGQDRAAAGGRYLGADRARGGPARRPAARAGGGRAHPGRHRRLRRGAPAAFRRGTAGAPAPRPWSPWCRPACATARRPTGCGPCSRPGHRLAPCS